MRYRVEYMLAGGPWRLWSGGLTLEMAQIVADGVRKLIAGRAELAGAEERIVEEEPENG